MEIFKIEVSAARRKQKMRRKIMFLSKSSQLFYSRGQIFELQRLCLPFPKHPHPTRIILCALYRCVYNQNICKTIVTCRSLTGDSQTMFQIIFLFLICTNGNCVDAKVQTKQKPIWVVYSEASVRDTRVFTCQKENGSEKTQKQSKYKCQGGIQNNSIF